MIHHAFISLVFHPLISLFSIPPFRDLSEYKINDRVKNEAKSLLVMSTLLFPLSSRDTVISVKLQTLWV